MADCSSDPEPPIGVERFEWDDDKDAQNRAKHGVSFSLAQEAFFDPHRVIARDTRHSQSEQRFYCIGRVGEGILTVRFTWRRDAIRIIGAGYWRKGRDTYERQNTLHG